MPTLNGARGLAVLPVPPKMYGALNEAIDVMVLVGDSANEGLLPAVLGRGLGRMAVILFFVLSGILPLARCHR